MCKCVYVWVYVFHRAHSVCEGGAARGEERRGEGEEKYYSCYVRLKYKNIEI